jgi:ElaB/YqjD/DUF883 family membrane-anchored ribosome-binding protein
METEMVDFTATTTTLLPRHEESRRAGERLDSLQLHPHTQACSTVMRAARQFIAARPKACIAVAALIGGVLGWLTTKK